ncbi:MAG TPA: hypothetical protein H9873_00345 [Candidatus Dorea gallistercoris]|uniref:DivIVA domain-containing protein n=1 Tax=Candidatus Dorea gallistercoris TaxID=2838542 RepID=A0A9D1R879_9FIRM|nr:hypothetical protein [Candidatus Dorea gallistercoris]
MAGSDKMFRTAMFGGYNREDVEEYVRTVEHEIDSIKVLHQKEKAELLSRLEESEAKADYSEQILNAEKEREGKVREEEKAKEEPKEEPKEESREETGEEKAAEEDVSGKLRLEIEELKAEIEKKDQELEKLNEKKGDGLFDYETVIRIMEEARHNAQLIEKEAAQKALSMVEEAKTKAREEEERQKGIIASRVNAQLEEKGIQLMAAKYKIEQYMKEIESAQQGLYNLNARMEKMVKDMPARLDDYWEGEHYRELENKNGEKILENEKEPSDISGIIHADGL